MDKKYECYKADWIVSCKCDFSLNGERQWKYVYAPSSREDEDEDEDVDWTAGISIALGEEPNGRVSLDARAEQVTKLLKKCKFKKEIEAEKDPNFNISDIKVKPTRTSPKKIDDKGVSLLLNHIISAQSTKSLTTIISAIENRRMVEVRGLQTGQPAWFFSTNVKDRLDVPYWKQNFGHFILSFPDLFFTYDKTEKKISGRSWEEIKRVLNSHRQKTIISVLKFEVNKEHCLLQLRFVASICEYRRGSICNCLPIPGASKLSAGDLELEPILVNTPEVVTTSPVIEDALKDLSDIWQDKASAILISAPPGSGKENFALSIPYGSGRKGDSIPTLSLADGTLEQQEKLIMGYQQEDGSIVDGMIARGKGFSVFIDEAHYPLRSPGMRAKLLRALEAKEYYPVGGLQLRKVEDVQWLFASSLPIDGGENSLGKSKPDDFWTRMSHLVRIEHPLKISLKQERVLKDFFKFFWWDRVKSHFGIDPAKVLLRKESLKDLREDRVVDQLNYGFVVVLLRPKSMENLAATFTLEMLNTVGEDSLQEVSIRGLRSMVSRIFARCMGAVTSNSSDNIWWTIFADHEKEINPMVNKYVCKIICETQQIAKLKH